MTQPCRHRRSVAHRTHGTCPSASAKTGDVTRGAWWFSGGHCYPQGETHDDTVDATGPGGRPHQPRRSRATPRPAAAVEGDTASEHREFGRSLRAELPLDAHAAWTPPADRPDPVALLAAQGESRIADLVPIRYGRMLVSPFTFLRGAALGMAADLARLPSSGIYVQACGDAHLSNFGVFATPERRLSFDVNDFDETNPAPFEWDVKRLAASLVVAAQGSGYPTEAASRIRGPPWRRIASTCGTWRPCRSSTRGTRGSMSGHGPGDGAARIGAQEEAGAPVRREGLDAHEPRLARPPRRAHRRGLEDSRRPSLIVRYDATPEHDAALHAGFAGYRLSLRSDLQPLLESYRFVDYARKVVGVGSVGTSAFVFLLIGRAPTTHSSSRSKRPNRRSSSATRWPSDIKRDGERVVVRPATHAGRQRPVPGLVAHRRAGATVRLLRSTAA